MKFRRVKEVAHIYLDEGETREQIFRAIAHVAFSEKSHGLHGVLSDQEIDEKLIQDPPAGLLMDVVHSVRCKVFVSQGRKIDEKGIATGELHPYLTFHHTMYEERDWRRLLRKVKAFLNKKK